MSQRSGPGESQSSWRIWISGTSKPDTRWAGEKLTWHEQVEGVCIGAFPKNVVSNQLIAHTGGVWPEDLGVPGEGQASFPHHLTAMARFLEPPPLLVLQVLLVLLQEHRYHCSLKTNGLNLQLLTHLCQCGLQAAGMGDLQGFMCHYDRQLNLP